MKKQELQELKSGDYVQSVKTGEVLEVVGMEAGKYMLSNGKVYTESTIKRWWNIAVVEPLVEEQDNTEEQDTTADTEETEVQVKFNLGDKVVTNFGVGEVVSVPHLVELDGKVTMSNYRVAIVEDGQRYLFDYKEEQLEAYTEQTAQDTDTTANTSDLKDTDTQDDQLHEDTEQTTKTHTTEGNTAINGAEVFTNNFGVELYTNSLSGIVIKHGCKLNRMKQYIAVKNNKVRGTLIYIRVAKEGGYHFDIGKTTWNKLDTDTQVDLVEQFDACIKDRTRGLWRISNCDDLDIFEKLLTTALDIA